MKATFTAVVATALLVLTTAPVAAARTVSAAFPPVANAGSSLQQQQQPQISAEAIATLRERLARDVAADSVGGITAAIVVGDRVVWAEGFGYADRDRRIPASVETIYRIGSISKSFTAVALAQLVQSGRVRLDDSVARFLPEAGGFADRRAGASAVTLRQLAAHTAGLIREPRLQGAASGPIAAWEERIVASIPTTSFDTTPGSRYAYSNIGYGVLGLAISRAAGSSFIELVERGIFAPLGMRSSTFVIEGELARYLSVGYSNSARGIDTAGPAREHSGRGYKVPNGGIYSTVTDLARFIGGMSGALGDVILNNETRAFVLSRQTPTPGSAYGLGFTLQNVRGVAIAGHGGSVAGYTAHLAFAPESRVGVILLRNYNSGGTNLGSVANETIAALLGR